jgi:Lrp/AsnC family leucine-responsive transcriptional regulator
LPIDEIDRALATLLSHDARAPLKALAAGIGLSSPATSERVRRLEDNGIVRGYSADLDPAKLGFSIEALVRVRPLPGRNKRVEEALRDMPTVTECDKVTGEDCFVVRLFARSIGDLDTLTEALSRDATTNTSIVKKQVFRRRPPTASADPIS